MKLRTRNVTVAKSVRQPAPVEFQRDQPGREDHRMEAGMIVRGNHHIEPAASSTLRDDMPVDKRDPTYLKELREHIAAMVKSKP